VVSVAETVTGLEIGVGAKGERYRSDRGGVTSPMRPVVRMAEYAWLPPSPRRHGTTAAAATPAPRTPGRLNETAVRARDDVVDGRPGGAGPMTYGWAGFHDRATPKAANEKRAHRRATTLK